MGNSGGAMHKYIDLMEKEPRYQGGFIWDYLDQSIVKKDRYGKEFQAYGGDFGDRPTDYNFSGNGIMYGDRRPSPKMQTVKYNYQLIKLSFSEGKVNITNKHLFTNTSAYECLITLEKNGRGIIDKFFDTDVPPLSQKTYDLPIAIPDTKDEYAITVSFRLKENEIWANSGHEVAFGQYVKKFVPAEKESSAPLKLIRNGDNIGIKGEHFSILFSQDKGGLASYKFAGRELIEKIPMPNFWRAPVDNDVANYMPLRYSQWKIASLYMTHNNILEHKYSPPVVEEGEDTVSVKYTYYLPTNPISTCEVVYTVHGDGRVKVDMSASPKGLPPMPEFGMLFKINADYENLEWYGMGPEETYVDRVTGARLGIYKNKVIDNMAAYLVPQECGNHIGVRYAKVTDNMGRGMLFASDNMEFSALPYTPHELENAMHHFELPLPHYTVLRVNLMQMGIAGDNTWGARTHDEYLLPTNEPLNFSFSFKGL